MWLRRARGHPGFAAARALASARASEQPPRRPARGAVLVFCWSILKANSRNNVVLSMNTSHLCNRQRDYLLLNENYS